MRLTYLKPELDNLSQGQRISFARQIKIMTQDELSDKLGITSENIVKVYNTLNVELSGKVAVKVHSGEKGNQNYLRPEF